MTELTPKEVESALDSLFKRISKIESKPDIPIEEITDKLTNGIGRLNERCDYFEQKLTPPTPERAELYTALAAAQGEIKAAETNQEAEVRNKEGKYLYTFKYADLAACLEVIREPLSKNGLALIQIPSLGDNNAVHIRTVIGHTSGQYISCEMTMYPEKSGPQAIGTCLAYLRRYSLCAMIGVAQFDDDAATAVKDPSDYERITAEEIDAILALADDLFSDKADFVIQQMVEKTFDVTHVSQIKAGEADLAITRLKNTSRREKAKAKKGANAKPSPKPPGDKKPEEEGK